MYLLWKCFQTDDLLCTLWRLVCRSSLHSAARLLLVTAQTRRWLGLGYIIYFPFSFTHWTTFYLLFTRILPTFLPYFPFLVLILSQCRAPADVGDHGLPHLSLSLSLVICNICIALPSSPAVLIIPSIYFSLCLPLALQPAWDSTC